MSGSLTNKTPCSGTWSSTVLGHLNQPSFLLLDWLKLPCLPVLPIWEFLPPEAHTRRPLTCTLAFLSSSPLGAGLRLAAGWGCGGGSPQTVALQGPSTHCCKQSLHSFTLNATSGNKGKCKPFHPLLIRGGGPDWVEGLSSCLP